MNGKAGRCGKGLQEGGLPGGNPDANEEQGSGGNQQGVAAREEKGEESCMSYFGERRGKNATRRKGKG